MSWLIMLVMLLVSSIAYAQPAPPAGMQWQQTFVDDFNSLDTTKWNGGYATTIWCGAEPNTVPNGPGGCPQNYFGVSVANGILSLAAAPNQSNFANTSTRAVLNSNGKVTVKRPAYVEIRAQMPHDNNGEGDGLWPALWSLPVGRYSETWADNTCGPGREEWDFMEMNESPATMNVAYFTVHDQCINEFSVPYPNISVGNLSAAMHKYGMQWLDDGSLHGTVCEYLDDVKQIPCHTMTAHDDTLWDNGIYLLLQVIPCPPNNKAIFNGGICTVNTSANNPMLVDYVKVWQLVPGIGGPTPTPAPTPVSSTFIALIGSPNVIDGGFFDLFWGFPKDARVFTNNQPNLAQQYGFVTATDGYKICNMSNGSCLQDGSNGLLQQGQGTDMWLVTPNGPIKNVRTGRYMGVIPGVDQGNVPMSATPVAVPLTLVSGVIPTPTPVATPTATPTPVATPTVASPDCAVGLVVVDSSGNTWTVVAGQVAKNGAIDTSTFNVAVLAYSQGYIYQQNTSGNWYKRSSNTGWMGTSAPACGPIPLGALGWTPTTNNIVSGMESWVFSTSPVAPLANLYLDDALVASTPPPNWLWDTTKVPNGPHTLREDDLDQNGKVVYTSSTVMVVSN